MGLSDAKDCGKMRALERLMASWLSHGDKVLLFSHSVRMLDILFLRTKVITFQDSMALCRQDCASLLLMTATQFPASRY
ncbi:hypothetical protein BVRB_7g163780 [Beta vulgaris subsp. vulgaris]|nr:hypothetical protein BVRB_7g163780 [Beta vulgaris subsp. vulgaris]